MSGKDGDLLQSFEGCWGHTLCFSNLTFPVFFSRGHISCKRSRKYFWRSFLHDYSHTLCNIICQWVFVILSFSVLSLALKDEKGVFFLTSTTLTKITTIINGIGSTNINSLCGQSLRCLHWSETIKNTLMRLNIAHHVSSSLQLKKVSHKCTINSCLSNICKTTVPSCFRKLLWLFSI